MGAKETILLSTSFFKKIKEIRSFVVVHDFEIAVQGFMILVSLEFLCCLFCEMAIEVLFMRPRK